MLQPLFNHIKRHLSLSASDQERLCDYFREQSAPKKTILLTEGSLCRTQYFVVSGCLRLFFVDEKGREQTTSFALENWWLTDYMAFGTNHRASFSIQAIEDSVLISISDQSLQQLSETLPVIDQYFRLNLQRAYGAAQNRVKLQYTLSREASFRHFSEQYPDFVQRIPQYMLASFLGFTPEYLSELRKKLSNKQ